MLLAPRGAAHTARYRRAVRRGGINHRASVAGCSEDRRRAGLRKITNRRILYNINNVSATSRAAASAPAPLPSRPAPASASIWYWRQPGANHDWREPGTILAMVAPLTAVAHLSRSWEVVVRGSGQAASKPVSECEEECV